MEPPKYECEGDCKFWQVLHCTGTNDYQREDLFKKCQGCGRIERLKAYREHWDKRIKEE